MGCGPSRKVCPNELKESELDVLLKQDKAPIKSLEEGVIRLVNVHWLLRQKVGDSGWQIPRHQELQTLRARESAANAPTGEVAHARKSYSILESTAAAVSLISQAGGAIVAPVLGSLAGSGHGDAEFDTSLDPLLPLATAARLLKSQTRSVFVLSYGWLSKGSPDPYGERTIKIQQFFKQLEKEGKLPKEAGLFWDFASLPQKPRTREEDETFKAGLSVMATLYASALGTTVIQLKEIPARPPSAVGKVHLCDVQRKNCTKDKVSSMYGKFGNVESVTILADGVPIASNQDSECALLDAIVAFDGKEAATKSFSTAPSALGFGKQAWIVDAYNMRPYQQRGWCILEQSVSLEFLGRATVGARLSELMHSSARSKVYDIDESPAVPLDIDHPQNSIEVGKALKAAKFTGKGDREFVLKMYERFQQSVAVVAGHLGADARQSTAEARVAARAQLAEEKAAARLQANHTH